MDPPFRVTFGTGLTARAVRVHRSRELLPALSAVGLRYPRPTLVLVGGAAELSDADMSRLRPLFVETMAPLAEKVGACVIDGGTDAGVMRLMGRVRAEIGGTFPLLGVAAARTVVLPSGTPPQAQAAPLEPHHTHFLLVPGSKWGDESRWLTDAASALADGPSSLTVLVNGGAIAWKDVSLSVRAGRPVIVVGGSGRTADTLTAALRGEPTDEPAQELAASELVQGVDLAEGQEALSHKIGDLLSATR